MKDIYLKKFFAFSPIVIMHQIYKSEGGLSEVEQRVLRELGLDSGGREVHVWQGSRLSLQDLLNGKYKST